MSEARLIRIQALSGLLFATFLTLHLANTAAASLGQGVYDSWQRLFRLYYQFPLVEVGVVLAAAGVHMGSGLWRGMRRLKAGQGRVHLPLRWHRLSGYFLLLAFSGHVAATRLPGLVFAMPADFSFLTFSLTYAPALFYPYYLLFALCGLYHLLFGLNTAGKVLKRRLVLPLRPMMAAGSILLVAGLLAMGGLFFQIDTRRFADFRAFYELWIPADRLPWTR